MNSILCVPTDNSTLGLLRRCKGEVPEAVTDRLKSVLGLAKKKVVEIGELYAGLGILAEEVALAMAVAESTANFADYCAAKKKESQKGADYPTSVNMVLSYLKLTEDVKVLTRNRLCGQAKLMIFGRTLLLLHQEAEAGGVRLATEDAEGNPVDASVMRSVCRNAPWLEPLWLVDQMGASGSDDLTLMRTLWDRPVTVESLQTLIGNASGADLAVKMRTNNPGRTAEINLVLPLLKAGQPRKPASKRSRFLFHLI